MLYRRAREQEWMIRIEELNVNSSIIIIDSNKKRSKGRLFELLDNCPELDLFTQFKHLKTRILNV